VERATSLTLDRTVVLVYTCFGLLISNCTSTSSLANRQIQHS